MLQCHTKPGFACQLSKSPTNFLFFCLTSLRAFLEGKDKGTGNEEPALGSKCHKINARHDNTLFKCNEALLLMTANRRGGAPNPQGWRGSA